MQSKDIKTHRRVPIGGRKLDDTGAQGEGLGDSTGVDVWGEHRSVLVTGDSDDHLGLGCL